MANTKNSDAFDDLLVSFDPQIKAISQTLRTLFLEIDPEAVEVTWPRQRIASYGVGPKKMTEHYVYIAPQKQHVNLGFYRGVALTDPKNLLEGSGKAMRHIKVILEQQFSEPAVRALIVSALNERKQALAQD